MSQTIIQVDAFTDTPFLGNPAAVCFTSGPVDERWMKAVAAEMNLSETAFLHPQVDGFSLRWLTPTVEVDLCGHATIASAHVLWESGAISPDDPARFHTKSGLLTATRSPDGWITLNFPAKPVLREATELEIQTLGDAIGVEPISVGRNSFDLLVTLDSEQTVRDLRPDFGVLKRLDVRGVIVTARASTPGTDFVSRFFAPGVGIDEDPVTGSSHTCLGPYWSEHLGKADLVARQVSVRGGLIRVGVRGDRVLIGGQAITVMRAELTPAALPLP